MAAQEGLVQSNSTMWRPESQFPISGLCIVVTCKIDVTRRDLGDVIEIWLGKLLLVWLSFGIVIQNWHTKIHLKFIILHVDLIFFLIASYLLAYNHCFGHRFWWDNFFGRWSLKVMKICYSRSLMLLASDIEFRFSIY